MSGHGERATEATASATAEPKGSALYEVLKGIDFEKRELLHKAKGVGLFDLVKEKDGRYRCYACTLCERSCPVDCIEIDFCPEFEELPFDVAAERAAAKAVQPEIDMKLFDAVIARIRDGSGLIEAFHTTQETLRLPAAHGRSRRSPARCSCRSRACSAWRASTASSASSRSAST